jgi:hypothetical protein
MPWAAIAGSVVSGLLSDSSASDASSGVGQANALTQQQIRDQQAQNNAAFAPYSTLGGAANARLSYLLGLTPLNNGAPSVGGVSNSTPVAPVDQGAMGGRDFLYQDAKASGKLPAYYQLLKSGALDASTGTSKHSKLLLIQNTPNPESAPISNTPLDTSDGQYGSLLNKFTQNDLNNDVVYNNGLQFGLDEGTKAIDRLSAARGGIDSGATLKALTKYANDYGTTKAEGAYNRFNTDKNSIYGMLSGQQGVGLNATTQNQGMNNSLLTYGASANQNAANLQGQYGIQGAEGLNNAIQGGIGNYLYGQRTANSPVTSTDYSSGYSSTMPKWYLS